MLAALVAHQGRYGLSTAREEDVARRARTGHGLSTAREEDVARRARTGHGLSTAREEDVARRARTGIRPPQRGGRRMSHRDSRVGAQRRTATPKEREEDGPKGQPGRERSDRERSDLTATPKGREEGSPKDKDGRPPPRTPFTCEGACPRGGPRSRSL